MSAWSKITETRAKFLFFPITIFYWGVIFWRNIFYNLNFFVSRRVPATVISIGNLTAGGTGKTPAVIYLSNLLKNKKYKVAVLDLGVKANILKNLANRNCYMKVFPHDSNFQDMLSWSPDAFFISNGPGDPEPLLNAIWLYTLHKVYFRKKLKKK